MLRMTNKPVRHHTGNMYIVHMASILIQQLRTKAPQNTWHRRITSRHQPVGNRCVVFVRHRWRADRNRPTQEQWRSSRSTVQRKNRKRSCNPCHEWNGKDLVSFRPASALSALCFTINCPCSGYTPHLFRGDRSCLPYNMYGFLDGHFHKNGHPYQNTCGLLHLLEVAKIEILARPGMLDHCESACGDEQHF